MSRINKLVTFSFQVDGHVFFFKNFDCFSFEELTELIRNRIVKATKINNKIALKIADQIITCVKQT